MHSRQIRNALMAGLVLAAIIAPAAHADSGPWIRWKQGYRQPRVIHQQHYVYGYHHDSAGPALVGFIGGLVIGSQFSHPVVYEQACPTTRVIVSAPPACSYDRYEYYDPYSNRSFRSLDECYQWMRDDDCPMVVEQIDIRSGRCVDSYRWSDGDWHRGHGHDWSH